MRRLRTIIGELRNAILGICGSTDVACAVVSQRRHVAFRIRCRYQIATARCRRILSCVCTAVPTAEVTDNQQSASVVAHLRAIVERVDDLDGISLHVVVDRCGVALGIANRFDLIESRLVGKNRGGATGSVVVSRFPFAS